MHRGRRLRLHHQAGRHGPSDLAAARMVELQTGRTGVNGSLGAARPGDASQLEIELLLLGLEQAYAADFRHCSRKLVAEAVGELLAARGLPSAAALLHE